MVQFRLHFDVYEDFLTYKSGVYHHVGGKSLSGHSIKILGWGVESGTPYLFVQTAGTKIGEKKDSLELKGNNGCTESKAIII